MPTKKSGIVLIIIGIIMIAYIGIIFATAETVVDLGQIKIKQEKNTPSNIYLSLVQCYLLEA